MLYQATILRDRWRDKAAHCEERLRKRNLTELERAVEEQEKLVYTLVADELTARLELPEKPA